MQASGGVVLTICLMENAYPRVCRDGLWQLLGCWGCSLVTVNICRALCEHTVDCVRHVGEVSSEGAVEWPYDHDTAHSDATLRCSWPFGRGPLPSLDTA